MVGIRRHRTSTSTTLQYFQCFTSTLTINGLHDVVAAFINIPSNSYFNGRLIFIIMKHQMNGGTHMNCR